MGGCDFFISSDASVESLAVSAVTGESLAPLSIEDMDWSEMAKRAMKQTAVWAQHGVCFGVVFVSVSTTPRHV